MKISCLIFGHFENFPKVAQEDPFSGYLDFQKDALFTEFAWQSLQAICFIDAFNLKDEGVLVLNV